MAASSSPPEGGTSAVSNQKVVKDMRSASVEVLRKTAKDVFLSKTVDVDGDNNNRRHDDHHHQHLLHPEDQLPKYDVRELTIGRVVGRGAFCVVKECSFSNASGSNFSVESGSSRCSSLGRFSSIGSGSTHRQAAAASSSSSSLWNSKASKASSSSRGGGNDSASQGGGGNGHGGGSDHEGELASRSDVPRRNRKSRARYVMKQLCPDLFHADKITYLKGLVDIAMETRFVASLDHDNIIAAHGVSSQDPFSDGYFIILEKINDTLSKRVKKWMDMDRQCKGITGVFTGSKKKLVQLDTERLLASYDLAVGMNYLHERNIAFRDLVSPMSCC
jgi:serine/threonine protein kinase